MITAPGLAAHPRIEIVGACDPNEAARAGFERVFGRPAYPNCDDLCADPDIDAIYIASPHEHHAAQAIAAARAGKHALVEKPMAVGLREAGAMIAAAEQAGTVLMIGPSHGYDAPVALAADTIVEGKLGSVRFIQALAYTDFLYRPRRPEELDRARGGGVVLSQATHQIDIVRRLAGAPVRSVRALTGDWDETRSSDGAFMAMLFFENGVAASLTYSGYAHFDGDRLSDGISELGMTKSASLPARASLDSSDELDAKHARGFGGAPASDPGDPPPLHEHLGFVLANCDDADIEIAPDGIAIHRDGKIERCGIAPPRAPRQGVAEALVAATLDGIPAPFDGAWGLHTLACCHAILLSSDEGREIEVADLLGGHTED